MRPPPERLKEIREGRNIHGLLARSAIVLLLGEIDALTAERDQWRAYAEKLREALEFYGQKPEPDISSMFAKSAAEWGEEVATWEPLLDLGNKAREALALEKPK